MTIQEEKKTTMHRNTMPPSLERAARAVRVNLVTWVTEKPIRGTKKQVTCYFAHEAGETIGVYSRSKTALRDLFIAYRANRANDSLVIFAGMRGFDLKCVPQG